MIQHLLRQAAKAGLNTKVPEDGVGLPASEELDVVLVDTSTKKSGCSSRPKRASAEEEGVDAGIEAEEFGGVAERGCDVFRLDVVPTFVVAVTVEVGVDHGVG